MLNTADKPVESFLHPIITPIVRIPTYDTLVDQIYQISYNAASVQTALSGRNLNFLALNISPMLYDTLCATTFVKNPTPVQIPHS